MWNSLEYVIYEYKALCICEINCVYINKTDPFSDEYYTYQMIPLHSCDYLCKASIVQNKLWALSKGRILFISTIIFIYLYIYFINLYNAMKKNVGRSLIDYLFTFYYIYLYIYTYINIYIYIPLIYIYIYIHKKC